MTLQTFLVWIAVGLIAGWLAAAVVGGGFGIIGDIVVGSVGAFLGGFIFRGLHVHVPWGGFPGTVLVAYVGAVVLLLILRLISYARYHSPCAARSVAEQARQERVQIGGRRREKHPAQPRRQPRQRGASAGDVVQGGHGRQVIRRDLGAALGAPDQRLERHEATRAIGLGPHHQIPQRRRRELPRPGQRQARGRRAGHVVRRVVQRALERGDGGRRIPLRQPAQRARRRGTQRLAPLRARVGQQAPGRLGRAGQLTPPHAGRLARGVIAAGQRRLVPWQRLLRAPTRHGGQDARRLGAHHRSTIVD